MPARQSRHVPRFSGLFVLLLPTELASVEAKIEKKALARLFTQSYSPTTRGRGGLSTPTRPIYVHACLRRVYWCCLCCGVGTTGSGMFPPAKYSSIMPISGPENRHWGQKGNKKATGLDKRHPICYSSRELMLRKALQQLRALRPSIETRYVQRVHPHLFCTIFYGDCMKTLKILGCIALIAAAVVYAAKTTYVVTEPDGSISFQDSKENLKKGLVPVVTQIFGHAVIKPVDPLKSQIIIVGVTYSMPGSKPSLILSTGAKAVKTKLAKGVVATLDNVGALVSTTVINPDGSLSPGYVMATVGQVQLKGVNVGTVFAAGLGSVQADQIVSVLGDAGAKGKGVKIQAVAKTGAFIGGSASNALGVIKGTVKGIDSKNTLGWLSLNGATPVKPGKTLVKAKVANTVPVYGVPANWKTKNVTITVGP
ncbi:MAG: hypothetical protein NTV22_06035 [bacterium]|nr:hypothetical protein [bacterium]